MNSRQLEKLGIPKACAKLATRAIQKAVESGRITGKQVKQRLREVVASPELFVGDPDFSLLAKELVALAKEGTRQPIDYRTWGGQNIDENSHQQMRMACQVPCAVGAALMPDAHVGYGIPIGGVLACDNAVIPYAVGVDIACRMKLSVLDLPLDTLQSRFDDFCQALERGTRFGVGAEHKQRQSHPVLDRDWNVSPVTSKYKDRAWKQLGTSGSGNHFAEFGILTVTELDEKLELPPGEYVALLSHSGSRGTGAAVCNHYSRVARQKLPRRYEKLDRLAWLDLDSEEGKEYWAAMNLMGDYASANHAVLHANVIGRLGAEVMAGVENHHNFAWRETHHGKDVIVHRKGATPAAQGVLGVIPGSMRDPAFVVRGKGNPESWDSAAHGAGRCMSRRQGNATFRFSDVKRELAKQGIHVLSAGADEAPGVYKNILDVMREQEDLVEPIARFDPKIVKMCGDGSRPED